jgi:hypothetical protein
MVGQPLPKLQKKHRQHHVWQHYLEPWSVGGNVWVCREGHTFDTGTTVVGVERDFYKLHRLSDDDIALLRLFLEGPRGPRHSAAKRWDNDLFFRLMAPVQFVEQNRARLMNVGHVEQYLDVHMTNALEDYHADIEGRFIPILDRLRNIDLAVLQDTDASTEFFHFIGTQYTRTRG